MKRKLGWIGLGAAAGSILLLTSVYAGVGDYAGYDAYKTAIKQTGKAQSVTAHVNVTVKDNDRTVVSLKSVLKTDRSSDLSSAKVELTSGTTVQSADIYHQADQQVIKRNDSEVYTILAFAGDERNHWKEHKWDDNSQPNVETMNEAENIIDSLVGNLRNQVTLSDIANGGKEANIELQGSQIPTLVNTIGSLIIKHGGQNMAENSVASHNLHGLINTEFVQDLPKLVSGISIHSITLKATIDNQNRITNQKGSFVIYGKDAAGADHVLTVSLDGDFSGFDETTPDQIDLAGKQTQTLSEQDFEADFEKNFAK